mmetsp:Transcript_10865/g.17400  ORF Transcript_10865/g.17400 Transcript_10865/m.17400 type:complete len:339 (+) Transcript_10865:236-1252(+)
MDYYDELGVTRSAADVDVKKAYRKLALKYHPDKDASPEAVAIFARVAEAYDVLTDGKLKATFDLLGEIGLKQGVPDGKGGRRGGIYAFDVSPLAVFERFFGTSNPYSALMDISAAFEALTADKPALLGMQRTFDVPVTLGELYHGSSKMVTHVRKLQLEPGAEVLEESRTLTIAVPPGCKNGQRFVFEKEGNAKPNMEPGPVVYTLAALKHDVFARAGDDLVYTATLPLIDSLCGAQLSIPTLDGRQLSIPVTDTVKTGSKKVVLGEGMPRGDGSRGDLIIVFDILFPKTLSPMQRDLMRAAFFFPGKSPTTAASAAGTSFLSSANNLSSGWTVGFSK